VVQTESDCKEIEIQTCADITEAATQTIVDLTEAAMQTDAKIYDDANIQAAAAMRDQSCDPVPPEIQNQESQTDTSLCQYCHVQPASASHCADCLKFFMASQTGEVIWDRPQIETASAEVQVGVTTSEIGLQAIARTCDEEIQVNTPDYCEQCTVNIVATYRCEDCLDDMLGGPMMMGQKSIASQSPLSRKTTNLLKSNAAFPEQRCKSISTCDAGLQVSADVVDEGSQAVVERQHAFSQVTVPTHEKQVEVVMEPICQRCHVNPVEYTECAACSEAENEEKHRKSAIGKRFRGAAGALKIGRMLSESSHHQTADESNEEEAYKDDVPQIYLCCECHLKEAIVEGGRCRDCVSYPAKLSCSREPDPSSEHRGSQGIRIGGGYDVLQIGLERGRMAAARAAAKETVRADSPSRMSALNDGVSPWQYVHGAPSTFSSPDRFHVGMLAREQIHQVDRTDVRLPPAGKKRPAVDAESLVRASLAAMNRDGPKKSVGGEPYLYRVMAPSPRRPDSDNHRPASRGHIPVGNMNI